MSLKDLFYFCKTPVCKSTDDEVGMTLLSTGTVLNSAGEPPSKPFEQSRDNGISWGPF
jgi:hypothetical protein